VTRHRAAGGGEHAIHARGVARCDAKELGQGIDRRRGGRSGERRRGEGQGGDAREGGGEAASHVADPAIGGALWHGRPWDSLRRVAPTAEARRRVVGIVALVAVVVLFVVELLALSLGWFDVAAACVALFFVGWFVMRAVMKRQDGG
jgi:hypothetical protein